ncbi:MAG: DUF6430 domain-containing protein [Acidiphilium sp.]|nr:DUF6430 domain-containing protein [Acidiphilium sp.]MDD4934992.1 DUF6430 domain-containing protein [Acidiphilium sp.]
MLAIVGAIWMFMEIMDFLSIYKQAQYSGFAIIPILLVAIVIVVVTRRPVSRITYRVPGRDYTFEVKIGDLLKESGDVVISSNTTFDTNIASGLIAPDSLQGQLAVTVFQSNTDAIDRQLDAGLQNVPCTDRTDAPGKTREYAIGTVAKVGVPGKTYYFVAMSQLNEHGTAKSTVRGVEDALDGVWKFIANQGELRTLVLPLMGTGRGCLAIPRKKMIERIAQSFADASKEKVFSNRLVIVVRPEDAERFDINLFEVRDYLVRSLHV